tara:strand:+ start:241 stop:573 length:333 start_codon:yes stop_codon:yes gene_type:complete
MSSDAESHSETTSGKKRKYDVQLDAKKKKRKVGAEKVFCYCGKKNGDGGEMVQCIGQTRVCLGGWYHIRCIEKIEGKELQRTKKGGVSGDFICQFCEKANILGVKSAINT